MSSTMLKAGEVPALLSNEQIIPLRPGESKVVADEIEEARAKLEKERAAQPKRKAKIEAEEERRGVLWGEWHDSIDSLESEWLRQRDELIAAMPPAEPFIIWQRDDGWWSVGKHSVGVSGTQPSLRQFTYDKKHTTALPPSCEVGPISVWDEHAAYDPTFKTFAEAHDWLEETATLGKHTFSANDSGEIVSCSDPEGLAHLAVGIQASKDAQIRQADRTAAYAQEALF